MGNIRVLGGVGILLWMIGIVLSFIPVLGILGLILIIVSQVMILTAIHKFAQIYKDKIIFNKYLIGFIILAIKDTLSLFFGFGMLIVGVKNLLTGEGDFTAFGFKFAIITIVLIVLNIIAKYQYKISFTKISYYSGIGSFKTAGNLLFIGSILGIILIGGILEFIGYIILCVAFFSIEDSRIISANKTVSSGNVVRICNNCGSINDIENKYCRQCGSQL